MPLKNRRMEYSWPETKVDGARLMTDKRKYSLGDTINGSVGFRVVGGIREAFHPDVWTVAWEDFDKLFRLRMRLSAGTRSGLRTRKFWEIKKEVRKASFYWSRDPDLPYRIWAMIVPEDGGPPKIPTDVEDAKSMMFDVTKAFSIPAESLGRGKKTLAGSVDARWGRRSFIEKGSVSSKTKPVAIEIE